MALQALPLTCASVLTPNRRDSKLARLSSTFPASSLSSISKITLRSHGSRKTAVAVAQNAECETQTIPEEWQAFASAVSGEWEGFAYDFLPDGSPVELPEVAVPQAFRDWGLQLFAWQSHSSTYADLDGTILISTKRFIPAVACDSLDPTIYSRQSEKLGSGLADKGVLGVQSGGSFVSSRPGRSVLRTGSINQQGKVSVREQTEDNTFFEIEHCLAAESTDKEDRFRARIVQRFYRDPQELIPRLTGLTFFKERWTDDYKPQGADSGSTSFAEGKPVSLDALQGQWKAVKDAASVEEDSLLGSVMVMTAPGGSEQVTHDITDDGAVFLPQGVWSRVTSSGDNGFRAEVGWLVNAGKAMTSLVKFSSQGQVQDITFSTGTKME